MICLLPAQANILKAKPQLGHLDIRVRTQDAATSTLKDHVQHADEVFLVTKFVSHSTQSAVKNYMRHRLDNFHLCNGAVTDITHQILNACPLRL